MKVLIVGATGAVGSKVLELASKQAIDAGISKIYALTRRPIEQDILDNNVENCVADFASLTGVEPCWQVDVVICALGTTLKQAGSKSRFLTIEHDHVMTVANLAKTGGAKHFLYVSSSGANANSKLSFYLATKGLIEQHLHAVGYKQLTILRPSLLDAEHRPDVRVAESIGLWFNRYLPFILPRALRAIKVERVALCLLENSLLEQGLITQATVETNGLKIIEVQAM